MTNSAKLGDKLEGDICFVVNTLSLYLVEPKHVHLVAAKHVMRYLKGMIEFGLYYVGYHDYRLYGCTDTDLDGSASSRNNIVGPRERK